MTINEFSDTFDVAISSYQRHPDYVEQFSAAELAFNEYEKSLFLTKAQEDVVKTIYNGLPLSDSFEKTETARRQLDALVKQAIYNNATKQDTGLHDKFNHYSFELPEDCWYIVFEQATTVISDKKCDSEKILDVYPVTHDDYQKIVKNPFRGPNARRALRLDFGKLQVELVTNYELGQYLVRYLAKPTPIVLCDLTAEGISIEGITTPTECKLSELLHQEILDRAVQLAVTSRVALNKVQK